MINDAYWCDGCKLGFPLEQLKRCGACRIPLYCSATCQAVAWKGGHKTLCREVVVEKKLLKGWVHTWDGILRWTTTLALNVTNRSGDNRNYCLEIKLRKTGSNNVCRAYKVLNGRVRVINIDDVVFYERNPEGDLQNRFYLTLLVEGERGRLMDATGLAWTPPNIHVIPETSRVAAEHCIEILKSVVAKGKPRHAVRDGSVAMDTVLLERGLSTVCFL